MHRKLCIFFVFCYNKHIKKKETQREVEEKKINLKFTIVAFIAILIISFAVSPIVMQNDTYYTVKIGEHIAESKTVDMQDPFSWHNLTYTYPHWLYDLGMYFIYHAFNWDGIYISTVVLSCILGLVLYFTNKKLSKNMVTSFILTIGVMYLCKSYIAARAQLPTFILFVLTIYAIERFLQDRKVRHIILLLVIPVLIANLHVAVWPFYFILYLPYIAEYLITCLLDLDVGRRFYIGTDKIALKIFHKKPEVVRKLNIMLEMDKQKLEEASKKRKERRKNPYKIVVERNKNVKWLILIMAISIFSGFCTPLGDTPFTYLAKTMDGNTTQNINEHLPLVLYNQKEILCIIAAIIAMLAFTDIKVRLKDIFLVGGLILMCLMSRRQISLLVLLGSFVANRWICYFIEKYAQEDFRKIAKFFATIIGRAIILGVVIFISYRLIKPRLTLKQEYVSDTTYPVAACDYILENLDIENMRIYNEYNYGSYMLYRGIPVFIDSRADLYSPEFGSEKDIFSDFLNISNIGVYYEDKFKEYEITHVIVYKNAKLNMFLSRNSKYKELYSDNSFVIYERLAEE